MERTAFSVPVVVCVSIMMLGEILGSSSVERTTDELPSHKHSASNNTIGNHQHQTNVFTEYGGKHGGGATQNNATETNQVSGFAGDHSHTVSIGSTGGSKKHENRLPYEAVNRWKRTA